MPSCPTSRWLLPGNDSATYSVHGGYIPWPGTGRKIAGFAAVDCSSPTRSGRNSIASCRPTPAWFQLYMPLLTTNPRGHGASTPRCSGDEEFCWSSMLAAPNSLPHITLQPAWVSHLRAASYESVASLDVDSLDYFVCYASLLRGVALRCVCVCVCSTPSFTPRSANEELEPHPGPRVEHRKALTRASRVRGGRRPLRRTCVRRQNVRVRRVKHKAPVAWRSKQSKHRAQRKQGKRSTSTQSKQSNLKSNISKLRKQSKQSKLKSSRSKPLYPSQGNLE